ncbi:hypothetical protein D9M69_503110 [compost metagenome]
MRRCTARRDQRGADAHLRVARHLQAVQGHQQRLERTFGQGQVGLAEFVRLEGVEALGLAHALGLVAEQHRVAVEGDAHFVRPGVAGLHRFDQHARGRKARDERFAHVLCVDRQEQVRAQRAQIAEGRAALREHAALQLDVGRGARLEDAHARHRVVAREDDHLDALHAVVVEAQQLADQRRRDAGRGRFVDAVELQLHVALVVAGLEDLVFFFEVEQGPRGDRDHEFVFERYGHVRGSPSVVT